MATAGIIAEYNPFHLGHRYQITALRRALGEDCAVVAVMSGNFVQRGDFALLPKHLRAEMALRCGVDLVLELPTVYAMATAETFARGGTALLHAAGVVTHLCFGSECGDLSQLQAAADCLSSEAYHAALRRALERGRSFAAARQRAAEQVMGGPVPCLESPNNNLGIEYLRALRHLGSPIEPVTVRRLGAAHDSGEASETASASLIRRQVLAGEDAGAWMPPAAAEVLDRAVKAGLCPASLDRCERAVLAVLRRMDEEDFRPYDGGGEGLYHRFYQAVGQASSVEELLERCKTRRYAMSRLRRMVMAAYLGLEMPPPPMPPCLRVLGATERGRGLLRRMKKEASLPVLTKAADVRRLGGAAEAFLRRESRYTDLYALACPGQVPPGTEFTTDPVML